MKRALYIIRVALISVELGYLAGLYLFFLVLRNQGYSIANLSIDFEVLKWTLALPLAISSWVFTQVKSMLYPVGVDKKLVNWKGYWKLKVHIYITISFNLISSILIIALVLLNGFTTEIGFYLYFASFGVVLISGASFYFADLKIKELYELTNQ